MRRLGSGFRCSIPEEYEERLGGAGVVRGRVVRRAAASPDSRGLVVIGTALSIGPGQQFFGMAQSLLKAWELFLDLLMEQAGGLYINGEPWGVELVVLDDWSDRARVALIYELLMDCGIDLFLAPYSSSLAAPAAAAVQARGAVMVATAADTEIYVNRSHVAGISLPSALYLPSAIELLAAEGAKSLAYVFEDSPGTRGICSSVPELAARFGLSLLSGLTVSEDTVASAVQQLAREGPDLVVGCVYLSTCRELMAEARRQDLDPKAFVLPICLSAEQTFLNAWSIGVTPFPPIFPVSQGMQPLTRQELQQRWRHQNEEDPPYQAITAFGSLAALVLAMQRAGSQDPSEVARALGNLPEIALDEHGQSIIDVLVVQRGHAGTVLTTVGPPEHAKGQVWYPRPRWQDWDCYTPAEHYVHMGFVRDEDTGEQVCRRCGEEAYSDFDRNLTWRMCRECPLGSAIHPVYGPDGRVARASCILCPVGWIDNGLGLGCTACPEGTFQNETGQTACTECPAGRFGPTWGRSACISCEVASGSSLGTFYASAPGGTTCFRCPVGGLCEKDAQGLHSSLSNKDGFYLLPSEGLDGQPSLHWCPHGDGRACLSHGRCHRDEVSGEEAMEGPMCGKCRRGFGRAGWPYGICQKCSGSAAVVFGLIWRILLKICLVSGMTCLITSVDFTQRCQLRSVIVKQFISYVQMSSVVMQCLLDDQSMMASLSGVLGVYSTIVGVRGSDAFALSCFSWEAFPDVDFYKVAQIAGVASVPLCAALAAGGFALSRLVACLKGWERPSVQRLVQVVSVNFFVLQPWAIDMNLVSVRCHHHDVSRLVADPSVKCWSEESSGWQILGGVACAAYALGVPLMLYLVLLYYRRKDALHEERILQMFGFLYCGFHSESWYFEFVLMVRRLLFLMVPLLPGAKSFHSASLVLLACPTLLLCVYAQPYDNRGRYLLGRIEVATMLAVLSMPLLQLWSLEVSGTELFGTPWVAKLNEVLCFGAVACLHAWATFLMLCGMLSGNFTWLIRERLFPRCAKSYPHAELLPRGIQASSTARTSQRLLLDSVGRIARLHVERSGAVTYEGLAASLQRAVVETHKMRKFMARVQESPIHFYVNKLHRFAHSVPVLGTSLAAAVSRLESALESRGFKASPQRRPSEHEPDVVSKAVTVRQGEVRLRGDVTRMEMQSVFSKESVTAAHGKVFSFEDMYTAVVQLRGEAFQLHCPPGIHPFAEDGESNSDGDEDGGLMSRSAGTVMSKGSGYVNWPRESSANEGTLLEMIEQEREKHTALAEKLKCSAEENERLRQAVEGLESRIARATGEASCIFRPPVENEAAPEQLNASKAVSCAAMEGIQACRAAEQAPREQAPEHLNASKAVSFAATEGINVCRAAEQAPREQAPEHLNASKAVSFAAMEGIQACRAAEQAPREQAPEHLNASKAVSFAATEGINVCRAAEQAPHEQAPEQLNASKAVRWAATEDIDVCRAAEQAPNGLQIRGSQFPDLEVASDASSELWSGSSSDEPAGLLEQSGLQMNAEALTRQRDRLRQSETAREQALEQVQLELKAVLAQVAEEALHMKELEERLQRAEAERATRRRWTEEVLREDTLLREDSLLREDTLPAEEAAVAGEEAWPREAPQAQPPPPAESFLAACSRKRGPFLASCQSEEHGGLSQHIAI